MKLKIITLALLVTAGLASCDRKSQNSSGVLTDTVVFKDMDTLRIDSINKFLTDSTNNAGPEKSGAALSGKGKIWKLWLSLHKNCQKSQIADNMVYFGVSNTLGIGTIVEIGEDKKIMADFPLLREKFTDAQKKLIFNDGDGKDCSFTQQTKVGFEFMAQSQISTSSNADINLAVANARDIQAKIDKWQVNNLLKGGLATVLEDSTNTYFKAYKSRLNAPNRYVIGDEIEVNGFSAIITTNTSISADLKAKLEQGLVQNVGETTAQVKFSYVNDNTIRMSTIGKFVVFCKLIEAKYIK